MRVLHISTSDSGGAGIAALRTHIALLESGTKSKFLCLYKSTTSVPEVYQFHKSNKRSLKKEILNRFGLKLPNAVLNKRSIIGRKGEYEIFTFPRTDLRVHDHKLVKEADIIQLHWIADFIDYPSFFANINKPIVWTLHDMNPFQGGFHYLNDKETNSVIWSDIENDFIKLKKESVDMVPNLHVVTPSNWLGESAKRSTIFRDRPIHGNFYYGIDFEVFKPIKQEIACEILGIPVDGIKILFSADNLLNKRKGFDLLLAALDLLDKNLKLTLITIGSTFNNQVLSHFTCYNLGLIKDERLINIIYNAADCFVLPSREDNFPNVMLEALACGLPIISFPVGGMAEVIQTGENGILAKDLTPESLAEAIQGFIENKYFFQSEKIRAEAMSLFNKKRHAKKYLNLYNEMLTSINCP
ncbi:glycosyltransferase [Pontibacter populi]|uniref:Glycosyltransferase n=1 Tax=Pontibacter populi TaxID=890055 RepID=A0ABV1RVB3_9BACT